MNATQKTIKYLAIAFAAFLAFTIIAAIGGAASALIQALSGIEPEKTKDFSQSYEDIESIYIDGYVYNVKVVEGTSFNVDLKDTSEKYKCFVKGKTLTLEYEGFSLGWLSWITGDTNPGKSGEVTITIPNNFKAKTFRIDAGTGSIEFDHINTELLDIDAGTGSINGKILKADKADIDCGVGSIHLSNVLLNDTEVDCGTGNVTINGELTGNNEIDGGIGNIYLTLVGSQDDYNIDVDSGMGDVTINGETYSDVSWDNQTAENSLEIDGGIGNINIDFE